MVEKIPCLKESNPIETLSRQGYNFYPLSGIDRPIGAVWIDTRFGWRCGEYDEDDICLCNRCAQVLGIYW